MRSCSFAPRGGPYTRQWWSRYRAAVFAFLAVLLPKPGAAQNIVEQGVAGSWGGSCTCPNGESYQVGDNGDSCRTLACIGGTAGSCSSNNPGGGGVRVTCYGHPDWQAPVPRVPRDPSLPPQGVKSCPVTRRRRCSAPEETSAQPDQGNEFNIDAAVGGCDGDIDGPYWSNNDYHWGTILDTRPLPASGAFTFTVTLSPPRESVISRNISWGQELLPMQNRARNIQSWLLGRNEVFEPRNHQTRRRKAGRGSSSA